MAINPCQECGGPVSTKSDKCPSCGAKTRSKTSPILLILIILFVGYIVYMSTNADQKKSSISNSSGASVEAAEIWSYDTKQDEMRGVSTKFAFNTSINKADFDFPYGGGSKLNLILRKEGKESNDVIFRISKGQFICSSYGGCSAAVKFGDSPVKNVKLAESDTHNSDTLFISSNKDANWFIEQLKTNKFVTVELLFYQEGRHQFKFNTEKLNW